MGQGVQWNGHGACNDGRVPLRAVVGERKQTNGLRRHSLPKTNNLMSEYINFVFFRYYDRENKVVRTAESELQSYSLHARETTQWMPIDS